MMEGRERRMMEGRERKEEHLLLQDVWHERMQHSQLTSLSVHLCKIYTRKTCGQHLLQRHSLHHHRRLWIRAHVILLDRPAAVAIELRVDMHGGARGGGHRVGDNISVFEPVLGYCCCDGMRAQRLRIKKVNGTALGGEGHVAKITAAHGA